MTDIHIGRFITRYRLPAAEAGGRARLDNIVRSMLDERLEEALQSAGMLPAADGELCMRRIDMSVRLRLAAADAALAAHWAEALTAQIGRALNDGSAIRYHSRHQALLDLALGVAAGDLRRSWAWRQLGLWQAGDRISDGAAINELVRLLCTQPAAFGAVIQTLAQADRLQPLIRRLTAGQWQALAAAVLAHSGAGDLLVEEVLPASPQALRKALQVVEFSSLLQALNAVLPVDAADLMTQRAQAILAVLETEPAWLGTAAPATLIALVAGAIRPAAAGSSETARAAGAAPSDEALADDDLPVARTEPETPVGDLRKRAFTDYGGLLFVLGAIDDLNLVGRILNHPLLGQRPLRWSLHALALALVPAGLDDPAVLALAGLAADAEPPLTAGAAMTTAEAAVLQQYAEAVAEQLRTLLQWPDDVEPAPILDFVCRRHAEILAEPGWIDVKLALDEVSTEIRRAGLDLNPGYLPWLGIVVRFVYD